MPERVPGCGHVARPRAPWSICGRICRKPASCHSPVIHLHLPRSGVLCRNANHLVSNALLLRLQRHTDHHMHGQKPFYQLRNLEGAPRLPADYSTMMMVAWLPPLWFSIMNPRVRTACLSPGREPLHRLSPSCEHPSIGVPWASALNVCHVPWTSGG